MEVAHEPGHLGRGIAGRAECFGARRHDAVRERVELRRQHRHRRRDLVGQVAGRLPAEHLRSLQLGGHAVERVRQLAALAVAGDGHARGQVSPPQARRGRRHRPQRPGQAQAHGQGDEHGDDERDGPRDDERGRQRPAERVGGRGAQCLRHRRGIELHAPDAAPVHFQGNDDRLRRGAGLGLQGSHLRTGDELVVLVVDPDVPPGRHGEPPDLRRPEHERPSLLVRLENDLGKLLPPKILLLLDETIEPRRDRRVDDEPDDQDHESDGATDGEGQPDAQAVHGQPLAPAGPPFRVAGSSTGAIHRYPASGIVSMAHG